MRRRIEFTLATMMTAIMGLLAFLHSGVVSAEVALNDGAVWVTDRNQMLIGRYNSQARTLDAGLYSTSRDFDITQFGDDVLLHTDAQVQGVDTATVAIGPAAITEDLTVHHGGNQLLILDLQEGQAWTPHTAELGSFSTSNEPALKDLQEPIGTVTIAGTAYVVEQSGTIWRVEEGQARKAGAFDVEIDPDAQLTTVGERLILLQQGTVYTDKKMVYEGEFEQPVLQQPGASSKEVLIADSERLLQVDLSGKSEPIIHEVPRGVPAAPVRTEQCVHALWRGSGFYLEDCGSSSELKLEQYLELQTAKEPVFRVNRNIVIINDLLDGGIYLPDESMVRVDNWDVVSRSVESKNSLDETDELSKAVKSILVVYGVLVILRVFHAARAAGSVPSTFLV